MTWQVSILDVTNESISYVSSSNSDYEKLDAEKSESGTSDSDSKTLVTTAISNWLQVTDSDSELNTSISVQNTEHKTIAPPSFD
jgi:hypothetical protein